MRWESVSQLAGVGCQIHVLLPCVIYQFLICAWVRREFGSHKPSADIVADQDSPHQKIGYGAGDDLRQGRKLCSITSNIACISMAFQWKNIEVSENLKIFLSATSASKRGKAN
jgi:hypothetical protein